jgi:peptide/nickel transport system substrate-binding protein
MGTAGAVALLAACSAPAPAASPTTAPAAPKPTAAAAPTTAAAATAPAAPATAAPASKPGVDARTIVAAAPETPSTFDPEHDVQDQVGVASVHATLVEYKYVDSPGGYRTIASDYSIQPMLAESFKASEDGTKYTFKLRQGVKSKYGNELTTDDVLYTFNRHFGAKAMGLVNASLWGLKEISQVNPLDKYGFEISIPEPRPYVLQDLAIGHLAILDSTETKKHQTTDDPHAEKWVANNDSGFGAYWVDELTPGQQAVLSANPTWFEGKLPNDKIIYKAVPEAANRLQLLQAGNIDIALNLTPQQLEQARTRPGLRVVDVDSNLYVNLVMNNGLAPFDNPDVRRAVSYAIPYDDILKTVYFGRAKPSRSPLTNINPDYDGSFWTYNTDVAKAKQLLQSAGMANGFQSTLYVNLSAPDTVDTAVLLQSALKQVGIQLDVQKVPDGVYGEGKNSKKWPLMVEKNYSIVDTAAFALPLFWGPGSLLNWSDFGKSGYGSYPFWDEVQAALRTTDASKAKQVWKDAQRTIVEQAGAGFIALPGFHVAMKQGIKGFTWHPDNYLRFRFLSWG